MRLLLLSIMFNLHLNSIYYATTALDDISSERGAFILSDRNVECVWEQARAEGGRNTNMTVICEHSLNYEE